MPVLIENVKKHNASRLVPETKHHDHVGDSSDGRLRPPDPVLGGTVRSMHKDTAVLGLPGELSRDNSRQAVPGGRWEPDDTAVRDPQSFCGQPGFDTRGPHQFRNIPGIPTRRPIPVQRIRRWCVCVSVQSSGSVVALESYVSFWYTIGACRSVPNEFCMRSLVSLPMVSVMYFQCRIVRYLLDTID